MIDVKVDPTFHMKVKKSDEENPEYIEYRRKWNENPQNFVVGDFPIHVDLETHTKCNLKCFMCFQAFDPPPSIDMDYELFKKVIDEGSQKGLCSLKTQYRGEPLLDRRMPEMVKYAKDKGVIEVMFNTNATLLTEETARALIEAGQDKIICSVGGYTKTIYESVRVNAEFEPVVNNIKKLQEIKKEMGTNKPILRVQMVDTPKNHHEIEGYIKFWGKIAEHVAVENMLDLSGEEEDDTVLEGWACAQIWQRLIILADGDVLPCCRAMGGGTTKHFVVGNANESYIEDIWKSDEMTKLRELHKVGRSHEIKMCRLCGLRKDVIKNKETDSES